MSDFAYTVESQNYAERNAEPRLTAVRQAIQVMRSSA
jgi:hypothetical protein